MPFRADPTKEYYEILGLKTDASFEEIRKAYRKLALHYHPDRNRGDATAEERFKAISEAYAVLTDPDKRRMYDLSRSTLRGRAYGPPRPACSIGSGKPSKAWAGSPASRWAPEPGATT